MSEEENTRTLWPWAIAAGFLLMIGTDLVFLVIATQTAPEIDPSYEHALKR